MSPVQRIYYCDNEVCETHASEKMAQRSFVFVRFGFAFTNARLWVEDQSTVNRATLHLAPLIVVWMLLAFRAWSAAESRPVEASVPVSA